MGTLINHVIGKMSIVLRLTFSISVLLTFWILYFFVMRCCPVHCGMHKTKMFPDVVSCFWGAGRVKSHTFIENYLSTHTHTHPHSFFSSSLNYFKTVRFPNYYYKEFLFLIFYYSFAEGRRANYAFAIIFESK